MTFTPLRVDIGKRRRGPDVDDLDFDLRRRLSADFLRREQALGQEPSRLEREWRLDDERTAFEKRGLGRPNICRRSF